MHLFTSNKGVRSTVNKIKPILHLKIPMSFSKFLTSLDTNISDNPLAKRALKMYRIDEASCNELPPKLSALLESLNEYLVNKDQHNVILLHYLMIESGFVLHSTSQSLENIDNIIPRVEILNNKGAGYRINYVVDSNWDTRCTLLIVPSGMNAVVTGSYGGTPSASFSMQTPISTYVQNTNDASLPKRFANLKSLSKDFKNKVALPLLSHAKSSLNLELGTESFSGLNDDAILAVMKHVQSAVAVVKMGMCSKRLFDLTQDNSIWKTLVKEKYPQEYEDIIKQHGESDQPIWYEHYRRMYRNQTRRSIEDSARVYLPPSLPSNPLPPQLPYIGPRRGPFQPRFDPSFMGPRRDPFDPRYDPPF